LVQLGEAHAEDDMERCKEYVARAKAINPDSEAVSRAGEVWRAVSTC
jgi:hypothetical protein